LQVPSPQVSQIPQSVGQDAQSSELPQVPSPQPMHRPQSAGQDAQSSKPSQLPFPHMRPPSGKMGASGAPSRTTTSPSTAPASKGGSNPRKDRPQPTRTTVAITARAKTEEEKRSIRDPIVRKRHPIRWAAGVHEGPSSTGSEPEQARPGPPGPSEKARIFDALYDLRLGIWTRAATCRKIPPPRVGTLSD